MREVLLDKAREVYMGQEGVEPAFVKAFTYISTRFHNNDSNVTMRVMLSLPELVGEEMASQALTDREIYAQTRLLTRWVIGNYFLTRSAPSDPQNHTFMNSHSLKAFNCTDVLRITHQHHGLVQYPPMR
jgi:hypothetical protein